MRFGRFFHQYHLHKWTPHYIDYEVLKKHVKTPHHQQNDLDDGGPDAFTEILRKEFAKVDDFYLAQYERLHARLTHTPQDSCSAHPVDSFRAGAVVSYDDLQLEEHIGTLLELLDHLEKLLWFGYVNYIASQRILDKFDRFTTSHRASGPGKLLFGAAFAQQDRCLSDIREVESALNHLVGLKVVIPVTSYLEDVPDRHHSLSKASEKPLSDLAVHLARKKRVEQVLYKRHQADQLGITLPVVDDALIKYLKKADDFGRVPLHYAAEAGLLGLCRLYLEALNESDQAYASSVLVTEDDVGNTPTHLSIVDGHVEVTEYLAEALRTRTATRQPEGKVISSIFGSLLHLAARAGHTRIVQILVSSGADINHRGAHEETVLHVAARNGNVELVRCMQNLTAFRGLVDLQESNWGRTALMSACIGGDQAVVELLLRAGSDPDIMDARGYTAKDHAAFQGHLGLLKHLLVNHSPRKTRKCSASDKTGYPKTVPNELSWSSRRRNGPNISSEQIHVRLGASNTRSNAKMVELKLPRWLGDDEMRQGAGFALEISLSPAPQLNHIIHLPPLEDLTNHPIIFETTDPRGAQIMFKIVRLRSFTGGTPEVIGSGVAILSSLRERLAPKHESLVRDHTIPIIAKDTLSVLGSVTFNFLIITPFTHVEAPLVATHGFWRDDRRTEVVGHRGSGANTASKTSLQIGENTIQSFMSAVASGASCIEFDVQLTKDLVPVIFHDFLVMETGGDVPLHTLTSAQFLNLSRLQSRQGPWSTSNQKNYRSVLGTEGSRPRSLSEDQYGASADGEIGRRMRYTEEGIRNDIKGNLRGLSIQEPSTTLEELLTNIPESIAFNLEIKYPMLWEAEDRDMDFFAMELNIFVDTILEMVYRLGAKRSITFSSFSPEVCIMLSIKQQDYPILFINKAGSVPTGDLRASNLQQAIHFVKAWHLAGIVMLSDVFVPCPRLLHYAKSAGLVCGSYGNLNDDPACAQIQAEAGLDAIMVNKVRLIAQKLAKQMA